MRRNLLAGLCLAVAAGLLVLVGAVLDLDLESVALFGAALGAVVALVPDRTPLVRLGGFAAGFVAAFIGYVLRAAVLPDTSAGRAVAVVIVLLLCVGVSAAARDRLPLWTLLLGTAGLCGRLRVHLRGCAPGADDDLGGHRHRAVPEPRGRLLRRAAWRAPVDSRRARTGADADQRDHTTPDSHSDRLRLNDMMETSK